MISLVLFFRKPGVTMYVHMFKFPLEHYTYITNKNVRNHTKLKNICESTLDVVLGAVVSERACHELATTFGAESAHLSLHLCLGARLELNDDRCDLVLRRY
jgi:hypothetical protein